jgi:hypothetical protein
VPFAPTVHWTFHPDGHYVAAVGARYAVDLLRPDGAVLRIEKDAEPVSVEREESAAAEEQVRQAMRRVDPGWRWTGPSIPQTKPLLRGLYTGEVGRSGAQPHQPGVGLVGAAGGGPVGRPAPPRFAEPVVFDVFERDGRYLGRVRAPMEFSTWPRPVFREDRVWATERDELGVQYVVRYRIAREGASRGPR